MDFGSPRGKRPLDMAVNLVPFIDLMAVTVVFLILSAVWTQQAKLSVHAGGTSSSEATSPVTRVVVTVGGSSARLRVDDVEVGGALDSPKLHTTLVGLKGSLSATAQLEVRADDEVPYARLIEALDVCAGAGWSDVSVGTGP